ncbi:MAG TPA: sugar ABC transporter substrate-binding protein [Clostridiaceae bacterium]|nr:sugar ABC transporter substrate-binding protein [Clostridiaceae bacterium]
MARYAKSLAYIASILILILLSIPFRLVNISSNSKNGNINNFNSPYRLFCVYSGSSDYYKYLLKEGLDDAASELNAWVKFYKFNSSEVDKHCEALDKAITAKVDGIITNVPLKNEIFNYIELAYNRNIPVITIEDDLSNSKRISSIVTNSYAYGKNAGRLMILATEGEATTAIFDSNSNFSKNEIKNKGFIDAIKNYQGMNVEKYNVKEPSIIEYINLAQSIFINNPDVNSFFCPDIESTLGVVRAMVEFNKTNCIVIGSGDSQEILNYIKNGIIYASLVEDPYSIGYFSVECMIKHLNGGSISESINSDVIIVTRNNVDNVLAERKDKD